jgi:hypothetical protein
MKKLILSVVVLVMMLVSIGGCWVGWHDDGRGGGHERGGGHGRGGGHEGQRH